MRIALWDRVHRIGAGLKSHMASMDPEVAHWAERQLAQLAGGKGGTGGEGRGDEKITKAAAAKMAEREAAWAQVKAAKAKTKGQRKAALDAEKEELLKAEHEVGMLGAEKRERDAAELAKRMQRAEARHKKEEEERRARRRLFNIPPAEAATMLYSSAVSSPYLFFAGVAATTGAVYVGGMVARLW